jgi:hypothetical protein
VLLAFILSLLSSIPTRRTRFTAVTREQETKVGEKRKKKKYRVPEQQCGTKNWVKSLRFAQDIRVKQFGW